MSNYRSVNLSAIGLFLSIFVFGWIPSVFAGSPAPETMAVTQSERPAVEVMFVLDTTSSMTGLIAAAKEKIWSIANTLASADPAPDIRMGLVGYRDRGDEYVTVLTPLSDDLDAVYARLMQFEAAGGGDTPESVNQALYEAVTKPDWSSSPAVYRVIFLVGDAPPKMNYPDDVTYVRSCTRAAQDDIVINTVQCGNMPETVPVWREIARLGRGETFQVAQSGSAVLVDTPYDEKIASLSRALDDTRIYYGSADHLREMEARRKTADEIYSEARPSAVAKRTIFNSKAAGAKNFIGSRELVHAVEAGELDLGEIPQSDLPDELKGMSQPALAALIETRSRERRQLQSRIEDLAKKRQHFIEGKVRDEKDGGEDSLDTKIYRCIQAQAAHKGIDYTGGPAY
ncbi:MAG: VWA domain-containing protein [Deltaproteobacteria bacterium]|nr:VWA domain-containing protein [Deltaproteobacteria bacterium]